MSKKLKCRPIPFSSAMVLALLAGRKTQTRRMLKVQPAFDFPVRYDGPCFDDPLYHYWEQLKPDGETPTEKYHKLGRCPYGAPGDRLWVREDWRTGERLDHRNATAMAEAARAVGYQCGPYCPLWYEADGLYRQWGSNDKRDFGEKGRLRVARFMPRWASRITLELLEVRVERLQEISLEDVIAEGTDYELPAGANPNNQKFPADYDSWTEPKRKRWLEGISRCILLTQEAAGKQAAGAYAKLWDSLHGDNPGERWKDNPWVWVLSFKRVETAVTE